MTIVVCLRDCAQLLDTATVGRQIPRPTAQKVAVLYRQSSLTHGYTSRGGERSMSLHLGMPAVPFRLPATQGETVSLEQFRGRAVLLSFYSLAFTPV